MLLEQYIPHGYELLKIGALTLMIVIVIARLIMNIVAHVIATKTMKIAPDAVDILVAITD